MQKTHIYGLEQMFKPVNDILKETLLKGVIFEENLLYHQTNAVFVYFRDQLPDSIDPFFLPAKMTMIIQAIDRHIAIQYKRVFYVALSKVIMERLNDARKAANGDIRVTIEPLEPKEKRILSQKLLVTFMSV